MKAKLFMLSFISTQTETDLSAVRNSLQTNGLSNLFSCSSPNSNGQVRNASTKCVEGFVVNNCNNILLYNPIVPLYSLAQSAGTPILVYLLLFLRQNVPWEAIVYPKEGRDIIILTITNKYLEYDRYLVGLIPEDLDNAWRFRGVRNVLLSNQNSGCPDCSLKQSIPNKNMSN